MISSVMLVFIKFTNNLGDGFDFWFWYRRCSMRQRRKQTSSGSIDIKCHNVRGETGETIV